MYNQTFITSTGSLGRGMGRGGGRGGDGMGMGRRVAQCSVDHYECSVIAQCRNVTNCYLLH